MIKLTINLDDTIEKFSLADLEKWRCEAMRCFKSEDISEKILSMTEKHFAIIEAEREQQVLDAGQHISFERFLSRCDELLHKPVGFSGMKIIVRE